jgi:hypothetical protein
MILPRPSVSPLHSFPSSSTVRRSPSTMEMARAIWRWLIGRRRAPTLKQQFREAREVEPLADLDVASTVSSNAPSAAGVQAGESKQ